MDKQLMEFRTPLHAVRLYRTDSGAYKIETEVLHTGPKLNTAFVEAEVVDKTLAARCFNHVCAQYQGEALG